MAEMVACRGIAFNADSLELEMKSRCEECGIEHTNGTRFCTRKCRIDRIRRYNGMSKKRPRKSFWDVPRVFDCDGNDPEGY